MTVGEELKLRHYFLKELVGGISWQYQERLVDLRKFPLLYQSNLRHLPSAKLVNSYKILKLIPIITLILLILFK